MVYYRTLKPEIKKAILNRQYSKEQLQQIHDSLERSYRKSRKSVLIAAAVVLAILVLCMVTADSPEVFPSILLGAVLLAAVFAFLIFVVLAMPKMQYVRCIKKAYPEYEESLGRNTFKSVQ
jgi:Flp pilus assembly protein TadB